MRSVTVCAGCLKKFLLDKWFAIRKFQGIGTGECVACHNFYDGSHLFLLDEVETETVHVCPHCYGQIRTDGYKVIGVWDGSSEPKCTVCGDSYEHLLCVRLLKNKEKAKQ